MLDHDSTVHAFQPSTLVRMAAAYEAALVIAGDEGSPFERIPARALRASLARLIVDEARGGVDDVDLLKAHALRGLAVATANVQT